MPPTWGSAPVRMPARTAKTRMTTATRSNRFTGASIGEVRERAAGRTSSAAAGRQLAIVTVDRRARRRTP